MHHVSRYLMDMRSTPDGRHLERVRVHPLLALERELPAQGIEAGKSELFPGSVFDSVCVLSINEIQES